MTRDRPSGGRKAAVFGDDEPCPAIMAGGINGVGHGQYELVEDGVARERVDPPGKPPYRVPTMDEVRAVPWSGLTVASTFAGCGGSCLGYRMAGFRVLWANEFVPAAQAAYQANANEECHLDPRDIAVVQPEDVLEACGLERGQLDVLDGSPPCGAFSTAGKRERGWGEEKVYEGGGRQLNETLFDQYIRLLRGIMPRTFVAENVSGLVKGTAKGFFLEILAGLKESGYRVRCKVLDAKWLGVPQSRQRTIFVGVREDLGLEPAHPVPLPYLYTLRDALPHLGAAGYHRGEAGEGSNWQPHNKDYRLDKDPCGTIPAAAAEARRFDVRDDDLDSRGGKFNSEQPSPTVRAGRPWNGQVLRRKFTIDELKQVCAFPEDFVLEGSYAQRWERLGNSVPPLMMRAIAEVVRDRILVPARAGGE